MTGARPAPGAADEPNPRRGRTARSLLDAVLLIVFVALCSQIAIPAIRAERRREHVRAVGQEARALYDAFRDYRERNGAYPDEHTAPGFDPATLEPLRRRGYYRGAIGSYLVGGRVDAYDAPDDRGPNHEFWIEMTLAADPGVRILVAASDDAPLGRGRWTDGVFAVRAGKLEPL